MDLVYLDRPFNSNATYNVLFAEQNGTRADGSYPKEALKELMERAACWMEDTIAQYGT